MIIVGALVVLFGAKRLPEAARGAGRSLRIFKSEVREMQSDNGEPQSVQQAPPPAHPAAAEPSEY
jgi:sec-independent protein translocase protein TatA